MIVKKIDSCYLAIKAGSININNLDATVKKLSLYSNRNRFVQFCPIAAISSINQIIFAAEQAVDSFYKGTNFSKKIELEFLVRLSATRQVNKAIGKMGLRNGRNEVFLIAIDKEKEKTRQLANVAEKETGFKEKKALIKKLGKNRDYLKKIYGLQGKELGCLKDKRNAVEEAILEKIALIVVGE